MPVVMGISAHYHDSACALLVDGEPVAAVQEERFTRRRFDPAIPVNAFAWCLADAGLTVTDLDAVAYYEDPAKKLARQLATGSGTGSGPRQWSGLDPDRPEREIREVLGWEGGIHVVDHHEAHAASSFFFSGFDEAAVLTVDGVGEWDTTTYGRGGPDGLDLFERVEFPHSLGLLYAAVTSYLGFAVNSDEYKVMGLAPYGRPRFTGQLARLVRSLPRGQYELDMRYFDFTNEERMYTDALADLLGQPPRAPESDITSRHEDVARSLQCVLEDVLLEKTRYLHDATGSRDLCMAGGVALNCVANGRILREGPFDRLFVQPAAGDAGGALGAAALAERALSGPRAPAALADARLGPRYDVTPVERLLRADGVPFEDFAGDEEGLAAAVAGRIAEGKVIGWFHGRAEFGPRALGARSILADPRLPGMRDRVNALVKQRENFRPFAPSVLAERASEHFDLAHPSPFMLETAQVVSPTAMPAITHVDGSARLQTVDAATNPRYHRLLAAFERLVGCPVLLNTSFNLRGEPIVCTPEDAVRCFIRGHMDTLVLEHLVVDRDGIPTTWGEWCALDMPAAFPALTHAVYTFV